MEIEEIDIGQIVVADRIVDFVRNGIPDREE